MNAQPHTHEPVLQVRWSTSGASWSNAWRLTYGDTTVRVCNGWRTPSARLVRRKTAKAIRRHDAGSVKAGAGADKLATARQAALHVVSEWGATRP